MFRRVRASNIQEFEDGCCKEDREEVRCQEVCQGQAGQEAGQDRTQGSGGPRSAVTVEQVEKLRDRLVSQFFFDRFHVVCDAEILRDWCTTLGELLKVHPAVLFDTLVYLAGRPLTREEANRLAWRLAGGQEVLRSGLAIPPWTRQVRPEESLIYLREYTRGTDSRQRALVVLKGIIYTGSAAGEVGTCSWPMSLLTAISRRVGFTNNYGSYPMRHASELVGLRICAVVESRQGESRPYFSQIVEKPALSTWNRKNVLALRVRKTPCPQERRNHCHECPVGLDGCRAATHLTTRTE